MLSEILAGIMAAADQSDSSTAVGRATNPARRLVERALMSTCDKLFASSHCQAPTEVEDGVVVVVV